MIKIKNMSKSYIIVLMVGLVVMLFYTSFCINSNYVNQKTENINKRIDSLTFRCDSLERLIIEYDNHIKSDTIIVKLASPIIIKQNNKQFKK